MGLWKVRNLIEFVNFSVAMMRKGVHFDVILSTSVKPSIGYCIDSNWQTFLKFNQRYWHMATSYLYKRTQMVNLSGWISKPINVTSGVPQGSHLRPLIFFSVYEWCTRHSLDLQMFYGCWWSKNILSYQVRTWCPNKHFINLLICVANCTEDISRT